MALLLPISFRKALAAPIGLDVQSRAGAVHCRASGAHVDVIGSIPRENKNMAGKHVRLGLVLVALVSGGCGVRSVNDLLADPAKYRDRSVTVRGTVAESASVIGRGAYRIVDQDQGLWVVTTGGAPRTGARVDVTGRLQDGYDLGAFGNRLRLPASLQNGLVLVESSHKARN